MQSGWIKIESETSWSKKLNQWNNIVISVIFLWILKIRVYFLRDEKRNRIMYFCFTDAVVVSIDDERMQTVENMSQENEIVKNATQPN